MRDYNFEIDHIDQVVLKKNFNFFIFEEKKGKTVKQALGFSYFIRYKKRTTQKTRYIDL